MHKYKRCSFANLRTKCPPQDDVIPNDHKTHNSELTEKIGICPLKKKKIQHFALFPKLIREMPLF